MAVSFVDCTSDRIPDLRQFFSEMYWPDYILSRDQGFLDWMFGDSPTDKRDGLHIILSLVDDRIRGCIGYIPVEISVAGEIVDGAWAANWMVDEQQRRLGLGPLLMRQLCSRFPVTLATGPNADAVDLLPRMGWTSFGGLRRYVRVLNLDAVAALAEPGRSLEWPERRPAPSAGTGLAVRGVDRFGDEASDLWDRTLAPHCAGTRRSADFLNWRYAGHPRFQHRLLEVSNGSGLRGFAVSRIEQVRDLPVRVGRILELVGDNEAQRHLLQAIAEDAQGDGVALLDFFCSSSQVTAALIAEHFLSDADPQAAQIPMLFQPLDRRRGSIQFVADLRRAPALRSADWYVTKSDGDQDRPT